MPDDSHCAVVKHHNSDIDMKTWTCILLTIVALIILAHVIAAAKVFYGPLWDDFKDWIKKRKKTEQ